MAVIAVPNPHYPPSPDALELAAVRVDTVGEITPQLVEGTYSRSASGCHSWIRSMRCSSLG
jgi:hypothetical protein